jgi:transposase
METEKEIVTESWRLPDELWDRMQPLLPDYPLDPQGGRPRVDLRQVTNGIFYVLRTGCQWKAVGSEYGKGSTLHRYFQEWVRNGVFEKLWKEALLEYDDLKGIEWQWQCLDGAMTKAPLGGEKNGAESDRSSQIGQQTLRALRWRWCANRRDRQPGEYA